MSRVRLADVSNAPLDEDRIASLVSDDGAGAVVTFAGVVRSRDHDRVVRSLTYEGHPTAAEVLADVARTIAEEHDVIALAVAHRIGDLAIGDAALVAAVASAHRGEAFRACQALVDLTKERLPVWKHQFFADGTDEWVNCA